MWPAARCEALASGTFLDDEEKLIRSHRVFDLNDIQAAFNYFAFHQHKQEGQPISVLGYRGQLSGEALLFVIQ